MAKPKQFEHYEVLERKDGSLWELGRGAMGVTYKAFDKDLHCTVALKVINPAILDTEGTEQRFLREARAAAQLRHPNIATVLRLGKTDDGTHFYAMEFCEGRTVEQYVADEGRLPVDLSLSFALQVTRALVVAEEHGVVHRDIKPANLIVVSQRGEGLVVKVIDFGLAKSIAEGGNAWTSMSLATAGFIGTAHFSSPEQLEEGKVDVRSDIYSLGATLWFMLTGKPMFSGSVAKVMSQHLSSDPPWTDLDSLGLPFKVRDLLNRMLAKKPDDRPQTALELKKEIEACASTIRDEIPSSLPGSAPDLAASDVLLGRWKLLEQRHGFRRNLYRAVDLKEGGKIVAVSFLDEQLGEDTPAWRSLRRSIEAFRDFPKGIVQPLALEQDESGRSFLVSQWNNGIPLVNVLRREGAFSWKETLKILGDLVPVYDFAASRGLETAPFCKEQVTIASGSSQVESRLEDFIQKPISDWPEARAVIDLLPLTPEEGSANETLLSMATMLPGNAAVRQPSRIPAVRDLALFVYELLGGNAQVDRNRYVPLGRIGAGANDFLKEVLTTSNVEQGALTGEQFAARLATSKDASSIERPGSSATKAAISSTSPSASSTPFQLAHASTPEDAKPRGGRSFLIPATIAAAFIIGMGVWLGIVKFRNSQSKVVATPPPVVSPALEGSLVLTQYSPKGDIRVEHRSGGWIYLVSQTNESKHFLLERSAGEGTSVSFSPDENWLLINEHSQGNDASSRLYRRDHGDGLEYLKDADQKGAGRDLADAGWNFYLSEVGLPQTTSRNEVRLSNTEWKPDSSGVKLRFDSVGAAGQKNMPQSYVCSYDVVAGHFANEMDVSPIRTALASMAAPSEGEWQKKIGDFVNGYVRVNQTTDTSATVDYYAPSVDYFDQGRVNLAAIRTDVEQYNARWPTRHDDIENNAVNYQQIQPNADYLATFNLNFFASSPARLECVRGKLAVSMHVTLVDGVPKITGMQQKTLQREKGALQVTATGFIPVWGSNAAQVARHKGKHANPGSTPSNPNQPDPAAAQIFNGILNNFSRGHAPPFIKPKHP